MGKGEVEAEFERALRCYNMPAWKRNYKPFPDDKREIDFAWVEFRVGAEIQEELYHKQWRKQQQDAKKMRDAQLDIGWVILPFTGSEVMRDPKGCIERVREALGR